MTSERESVLLSNATSFETVLDQTCERLWGKKVRYSLQRLQELNSDLQNLDAELDAFLRDYERQHSIYDLLH
ncbi:MAG: hypothetical protein LBD79_03180 [Treponema sp.]|jgi:transposase|nr:hypothetical protein [Treponema sp.]